MSWNQANTSLSLCESCINVPDQQEVKWALMASNLRACTAPLQKMITDDHAIICSPDGCASGYGMDTKTHHVFDEIFSEPLYTVKDLETLETGNAWRVVKSKIDAGLSHDFAAELDYAFENDGVMKNRIQSFELLLSDYCYWLTDTNPKAQDPAEYIQNLGLLHWKKVATGMTAVILEVNRTAKLAIRKPLWPDNGLTYFFDPSPENKTHGYTRNGNTGKQGYKEWVGMRKNLELKRIRAVYTPITLKFSWDAASFCAGSWERLRLRKIPNAGGIHP